MIKSTLFRLVVLLGVISALFLSHGPVLAQEQKSEESKAESAEQDSNKPEDKGDDAEKKEEASPENKKEDKKDDTENKDEASEEKEPDEEMSEEEAEKKGREEELKKVQKMLGVFKSLEGEWTGEEKVEYLLEPDKKDKVWKDEWKGFYTQNGRYFEMTGKSEGDLTSTYHWYVTYDSEREVYRAWSFGSTGFSEYDGDLADDGKSVVWRKLSQGEEFNVEDTFQIRGDGNKASASGTTALVSKDGKKKIDYARQLSSYTRKKIEI